jgi:hypothetical protein
MIQRFLNLFHSVPERKERSWRFNYESCSSKSEAVDVVGMRLDDVEKKIKGPKGSKFLRLKSRWYY